ncbi:MAG: DUF2490 domain-containing protein, partial [Acidobacteria bacterium]
MKRIYLVLLIYITLCGFSFAQDTDDIVNWNDVNFILPVIQETKNGKKIDRLTLTFNGVLRIGRNLKRPIDERAGIGFSYHLNRNFSVGSSYLYRRSRPTEAPRQFEHRLNFFLTAEKKMKYLAIRNRFMTMYQIRHTKHDAIAQRNRLQFLFPIRKDDREILSPFVTDEIYYDFKTRKLYRNDLF